MSEVLKQPAIVGTSESKQKNSHLLSYLPAILAVGGSVLLVLLRIQVGGAHFISDGALMMLALASYLTAAAFHLTNLYAPSNVAQRLGLWCTTAGVFFNLSSWGVRWVAAHDRELQTFLSQGRSAADLPWAFRYIPFANLYDLSLAFAFGAGITTLLIAHRKNFRFLGAISLPLAAIILMLARFIGSEFIDLPPVLDSYWRPIHVGTASLSYGVALVCFAVAVMYLLKDGVRTEAFAVWSSIFGVAIIATISNFSVFWPSTFGTYTASTFVDDSRFPIGIRANLPYVGWVLVLAGLLLLGTIAAFLKYLFGKDETARRWGHRLLKLAFVAQACAVALLMAQVKSATVIRPCADVSSGVACIAENQYENFSLWQLKRQKVAPAEIERISTEELRANGEHWVRENYSLLKLSSRTNPVELSALITALAATLFVIIFSFRTERLRAALPAAEKLDSLVYKLAGVAFAGLAILLMTGAIWANESWGRYWGWDSKETGAFVAWLTYGAFLHARISRGWYGRRSAYFAVVAFLLVIFTYLGVSYLLPGLHSYA